MTEAIQILLASFAVMLAPAVIGVSAAWLVEAWFATFNRTVYYIEVTFTSTEQI